MTQRIVLFNGPPRCGKDTAARACLEAKDLNSHFRVFDRMSMPIKRAFAGMMHAPIDRWGNVEPFESKKEEHNELLNTTYRMWQIEFSERFMKPHYKRDTEHVIHVNNAGTEDEFKRKIVSRIAKWLGDTT